MRPTAPRTLIPIVFLAVSLALAAVGCDAGDDPLVTDVLLTDNEVPTDIPESDATTDVPAPDDAQDDPGIDGTEPDVAQDVAPDAPDTPDAPVPTDVPGEVTPEIDPVLADALAAILAEHATFSADRGLTLTVRDAAGAWWTGAAGEAVVQDATAMTPDTRFRVGSNTKPFVAIVIMQLVDEGLVGLDGPITDYVPDYPQWSDITIRHLLAMRSGIPEYLRDAELMLTIVGDPTLAMEPMEVLDYIADDDLLYLPGEGGHYTNSNYLLLGLVIEEVLEQPADQVIHERLIAPLGLDNTFLDLTGEVLSDLAHGYMDLALVGILFGVPASVIDFIPTESVVEGTIIDTTYLFHPSITWTAGAMVSTTRDMGVLIHALLTGDLVSPASLAAMQEAEVITLMDNPVPYGLGLQVRPNEHGTIYGHGGLNFGYQAGTYYLPDAGVTVSHMHNFLPEQSDGLQNEVLDALVMPPEVVPVPCLEPAGFYSEAPEAGLFQGRFKGPVNDFGAFPRAIGIGVMSQHEDEGARPLYGIGVSAILKAPAGGKARVDIESLSPTGDEDSAYRLATISIERDVLSELDASGQFTATGAGVGRAYVSVTDLWTDPGTGALNKICVRTLSDFSKSLRIQVCEAESFEPNPGENLRIFVEGPLLTDPTAIAQTLAALNLPECSCLGEGGTWAACP